jgi:hypothetical protein
LIKIKIRSQGAAYVERDVVNVLFIEPQTEHGKLMHGLEKPFSD